ncbi:MAG TPA: TIGR03667 family PPOX class F420-dependent oxidoreductase [Actinomycetota bacterium]|nr:TIGR03667 family PPOX class F420-dependent oxidoreductase [Actinomycetota bacterium]
MKDDDRAHADRRLKGDLIIWLSTVNAQGQPQTSPVWFWWDGEAVVLFSMPRSAKVANIRQNPKVSLNLDGNGQGGDIVSIEGTAELFDDKPLTEFPEYLERYREKLEAMGYESEPFAHAFSAGIRVTPTRFRVYI